MIIRYRSHLLREPGKFIDIVFYKDAYVLSLPLERLL